MYQLNRFFYLVPLFLNLLAFQTVLAQKKTAQPVFKDTGFLQAYSIKYIIPGNDNTVLNKVCCDRNGIVQVYSSKGILKVSGGQFLYPGELLNDVSYPAMTDKKISAINLYQRQFVYADDKAVLSNAWAGTLYDKHSLPEITSFCGGNDFAFLVTNGLSIQYIQDSKILWEGAAPDRLTDILFDVKRNLFWLLSENNISVFDPAQQSIHQKLKSEGLTCFALVNDNDLFIGTHKGFFKFNINSGKQSELFNKLPCNELTVIKQVGGHLWFGSNNGSFMLQDDGRYKYYASKRWIPSNKVIDIAEGEDQAVLILTDKGLGAIHFSATTLLDKAMFYEKQVRARHIRLGFNATIAGLKNGNVDTGSLEDSDNDGLWTSMYLGAEVFRYAATHSPQALENCKESLEAMERLYTINSLKGFPSRSFERRGYEISDVHHRKRKTNPTLTQEYPGNAGLNDTTGPWKNAADPEWDWKSTTSSDEAIGHMFVFGAIAELIDIPEIKNKAIRLMDALMQHIVDHEMYLVDWNNEPTKWGRWNPEYVNARPKMVGDRKITSSNIISMLQTAWHFTGKKIYKDKAFELMNKFGYLENLMRPMKEINYAPEEADELSKDLSDGWNHSDDEMYFLGYWGLYRYALNDTLKTKFKKAILDHWEIERPEKEGAWDIFTAITGVKDFDLNEAVWYLQKYPLDMVNWKVHNSERQDIEFIPKNFRRQTIKEVLPPDELPIERHNSNRFGLDGGDDNGSAEYSAGDIWLLPYWMARYLKVITSPVVHEKNQAGKKKIIASSAATGYVDKGYEQHFSIKYKFTDSNVAPLKMAADHNGNIKILTTRGIYAASGGALLEPGELIKDYSYLPVSDKNIVNISGYQNEFVYLDDKAVFSNAWAGSLYNSHHLPSAKIFCGGNDFAFLVSDGKHISLQQHNQTLWETDMSTSVTDIRFGKDIFWLLTEKGIYSFAPASKKIEPAFCGEGFTCFNVSGNNIYIGTHDGYIELRAPFINKKIRRNNQLPCNDITSVENIDGHLWFGSTHGAFMQKNDGKFDYYASERWLPGNKVIAITKSANSILILTDKGLGKIYTKKMSLAEKADYYEKITRQRHIRYGFYCDYTTLKNSQVANTEMRPHDSDNLWTSMYLCAELFRYLTTHDQEARQNCIESLDAMERLFTLSGIKGLFGRCIERRGTIQFKPEVREENKYYWYPGYDSVPSSWKHSTDSEWDWRGSASSDQAVGQYFAWILVAQYMDDNTIKQKAIRLIDELTGYIVDHNMQLIDVDGKPTLWGRWNPEYVNRFPDMVGDKKLYSSNIIAFLQAAWHFTHKEKYRDKALQLLYTDHYLKNLSRPIAQIGPAPAAADAWSRIMSESWNSSDDEMYFLAYWGLYPYALNNELKKKYAAAIKDHWNRIRPEREWLWNISYAAITGHIDFDMKETIWSLKRMPLDLINWSMNNSRRKDIVQVKENFFGQTTTEVLPPDERPENKHNRDLFKLDDNGNGYAELGGGDVFLLPYWMGRYFGLISRPVAELNKTKSPVFESLQ
ncbi:MAG TPA: hypothetical protein VMT76_01015 [Puia sp.]|nr:hypothetical protein [Puia sp.]